MRKYGFIGGTMVIMCFVAIIYVYLHARRPAPASPQGPQHKLMSYNLSPYNLPSDAVEPLKAGALGGNCNAAEILTRYYFDVLLDFYSGLRWVRVAAKNCPDAEAKMELGMILVHYKTDPKAVAEISDLIVQIQKVNPQRATQLQSELER